MSAGVGWGRADAPHRVALLGVPYDTAAGLGRPGARFAPRAIREALGWSLARLRDGRVFDVEAGGVVDLSDWALDDLGDVEVAGHDHVLTLGRARDLMATALARGAFPIALGGDHSVSLPLLEAFHDHHDGPLGIVQLDAHLDLVDEHPRQGRLSGSSQMRRALELPRYEPGRLVQLGVRGFNYPDQHDFVRAAGIHHVTAAAVRAEGARTAARRALDLAGQGGARVYLTLDVDCLDPAFAPGSGADEPGGLTSAEVLDVVREAAARVDAVDLVEVNPPADRNGTTSALAAHVLFTLVVARAAAR